MKFHLTLAASTAFIALISAMPQGTTQQGCKFDASQASKVGLAQGGTSIGGQCLSDADCGGGCCTGPCGICSGLGACFQKVGDVQKQGCGFPLFANPSASVDDQCHDDEKNRSGAKDAGKSSANASANANGNGSGSSMSVSMAAMGAAMTTPAAPGCSGN